MLGSMMVSFHGKGYKLDLNVQSFNHLFPAKIKEPVKDPADASLPTFHSKCFKV